MCVCVCVCVCVMLHKQQRGDIKIFDFGLAKELPSPDTADKDGAWQMTGETGTPRYVVIDSTCHCCCCLICWISCYEETNAYLEMKCAKLT